MIKRLRIAWRFRIWPWRIPANVVRYVSLAKLTQGDIKRTDVLAARFVWERSPGKDT